MLRIVFVLAALQLGALVNLCPKNMAFDLPDHRKEVCFRTQGIDDERVTCQLGIAGVYPPQRVVYGVAGCCFEDFYGEGVFWAMGEQHVSRLIDVSGSLTLDADKPDGDMADIQDVSQTKVFDNSSTDNVEIQALVEGSADKLVRMKHFLEDLIARFYGGKRHTFAMEEAVLADLLVLDAADDQPIEDGYVTFSDDAIHLLNEVRRTDEDGYAVLPLIAGEDYVVTLRASGYLQPSPLQIHVTDEAETYPEIVVTLSRGVTLSGKVVDALDRPVGGAMLVVSVLDSSEREIWHSTLDRPKAFADVVTNRSEVGNWVPERPSITCDERGRFKVENVPFGKIRVYAVSDGKMPGTPMLLDAREEQAFEGLTLHLAETHWAWFRITNRNDVPVAATLEIVEPETGYALEPLNITAKSASRVEGLPSTFLLTVRADGYETLTKTMHCQDGDEFVFSLNPLLVHTVRAVVRNEWGERLEHIDAYGIDKNGKIVCSGKTDTYGMLIMEACPVDAVIRLTKEGYASYEARMAGDEIVEVTMTEGVILKLSGDGQLLKSCSLYDGVEHPSRSILMRQKAVNGSVVFEHLGYRPYYIECTHVDGRTSVSKMWQPVDKKDFFEETIIFEKRKRIEGIIMDAYGAPVPYAEIVLGNDVLQCDEQGRFGANVDPSKPIHICAQHWLYGRIERIVEVNEFAREIEIRLEEKAPVACIALLEEKGVMTMLDGSTLRIDHIRQDSPWIGKGFMRGDYVESCDRGVVVVRNDKRLVFQLK